jgi:hypothetical protein
MADVGQPLSDSSTNSTHYIPNPDGKLTGAFSPVFSGVLASSSGLTSFFPKGTPGIYTGEALAYTFLDLVEIQELRGEA